jgi:uncharacterized protein (DUF58 family)
MSTTQNNSRSLSPEVLTRIANLKIGAKKVVEGILAGMHKSPHHGVSIEFTEHKEYVPGDEIRHLDWRVLGKSDRYYIKKYEKETNLKAVIFVDASGSMDYGSGRLTKLDFAIQTALCLTYLFLRQSDGVGLFTRKADEERFIPPSSQMNHFSIIAEALGLLSCSGETDMGGWIDRMLEQIPGTALCIILSDLFCDENRTLAGLKSLCTHKKEVMVFHVLDPAELAFPFTLRTKFKDMEIVRDLTVEPLAVKNSYLKVMEEFIENLKSGCLSNGVEYYLCDTSIPVDKHLFRFLGQRGK